MKRLAIAAVGVTLALVVPTARTGDTTVALGMAAPRCLHLDVA